MIRLVLWLLMSRIQEVGVATISAANRYLVWKQTNLITLLYTNSKLCIIRTQTLTILKANSSCKNLWFHCWNQIRISLWKLDKRIHFEWLWKWKLWKTYVSDTKHIGCNMRAPNLCMCRSICVAGVQYKCLSYALLPNPTTEYLLFNVFIWQWLQLVHLAFVILKYIL